MKKLKQNKFLIFLFYIIILGGFFRLYNLNWDEGHFLHPDERLYVNASNLSFPSSLEQFLSPDSPLNPNMFYYGTFPLYLYSFIHTNIFSLDSFLITSRFISSLFSIATIPIIFLIGTLLFDKRIGIYAAIFFAFAPGSIQHAHFNTTESILVFLLSLILLLSSLLITKKRLFLFSSLGFLLGASYATKITGLAFAIIPLTSIFVLIKEKVSLKKILLGCILFALTAIICGAIFAPYQIIDFEQFSKEQEYMQGVTYGKHKPPFIIIYENTIPYIYSIVKILPFTFGFIAFPLSIIGLVLIFKQILKKFNANYFLLLIIVFPLIYFFWSGMWYAKFSRYYLLLFPFLSIWGGYALSKINTATLRIILILTLLNGLMFMNLYIHPHTRIEASRWIYNNIPKGSTISGEHWDDNLPLPIQGSINSYRMLQLIVYDQETIEKVKILSQTLAASDYIIFSSRRVYYSILQNSDQYPFTNIFYRSLFQGELGFKLEKRFTNYPFFLNDDIADETFQSYDHPPVIIFKNEKKLTVNQLERLITNVNKE